MFLKRIWGGLAINLAGIFLKRIYRTDRNKLPETCVFVANHSSYLDIIVSCHVYPHNLIYMGKAELLKVPLFNIFFKKLDIPVNRKSTTAAHQAYLRSGEEIDKGNSMCIFPEGTISNEGVLKPFKNGAFKLAIEKQVPIVAVTFVSNWKLLQNGGFFKSFGRPGLIRAIIHEPIPTKGMTEENLVSLRQQVYDLTVHTLEEFNRPKK
ncbi:MAG: 1-acyl-sn-glycerol-3-phosphate acyltransferase [Bacteroidetes bacterium]|nr:1-acyl-sn-glycerol-3-phosphate acyltransferase [Bacteroidota bacterium]